MATPKQLNGPLGPTYDPRGQQPTDGWLGEMVAGTGIKTGSGTIYRGNVYRQGGLIKTEIFIDLTGLNSSAAADIIGKNGTANCHLGQWTTALNGIPVRGRYSCIEAPATGEPDIDVAVADEATGTEDAAITALSNDAYLKEAAADFTAAGQGFDFVTLPGANQYIYLVGSGGGTDATYTAGQFLLEFWGVPA